VPTVDPAFQSESSNSVASARLARRVLAQWPMIIACALVAAVAAYVVSAAQTKQYAASATLQLSEIDLTSVLLNQSLQQQGQDASVKASTNAALVMTPRVRAAASRILDGEVTPQELKSGVTVTPTPQTTLLVITATDTDPEVAVQMANAMGAGFVAVRRQNAVSQFNDAKESVQTQLRAIPAGERETAAATLLNDRLQQLDTLRAAAGGGVIVTQPATPPEGAVSPKPKRNAILALLVGGLFGLGIALLRARLDDRIRDTAELSELWDLPVLGLVPDTKDLRASGQVMPSGPSLEAFALARTNLRYLHVGGDIKTVVVTSASEGEGKSTVAWNLALAAALAEVKVLIIEADLRRPVLAARAGLVSRYGLSEILAGLAVFDDAVETASFGSGTALHASVDVITAGLVPPSPIALLERPITGELLRGAALRYDLVIIDSPPATVVADAKVLASQADGVLIVSRLGRVKRSAFRRLRDLLADLDTPVLGTIVNGGVSEKAYGYSSATPVATPTPSGPERERVVPPPTIDEPRPRAQVGR
jgi:capsular exopolysaccharide synthesis family protein